MSGGAAVAGLDLASVDAAAARIAPFVRRTPLERSAWLSRRHGAEVALKLECWQPTGSFKLRGALAALTALDPEARARGVLAVSAGNHGQALAWGATALGVPATIVVPASASRTKVLAMREYPIELIERGADYDEAERLARALARERDVAFVSPYNDPAVIAGQATIARELLEADPALDAIIVPCGGGGVLAGIALAIAALAPRVRVWGAEPAASPTMRAALDAGGLVAIAEAPTLADGLAGNVEPGAITYPLIARHVDALVTVPEADIRDAMRGAAAHEHLILEGSAAVAIAALARLPVAGRRVAVVATGRNVTLETFLAAIAPAHPA